MYLAIFAGGILLDRLTKLIVMQTMTLHEHIAAIPGLLNFFYVTNEGAAFSILEGNRWLLIFITVLALVALAFMWRFARNESMLFRVGVAAIASGAVGNFIDRLIYGKVVDFFQFGFWETFPVFNVADIFITCGAAFIIIDLFISSQKQQRKEIK